MKHRPTPFLHVALFSASVFGLVFGSNANAQLADSPWPMFQHDAQHSGRSSANGPQGPNPKIAWYAKTRSRLQAAVSVAPDLTIIAPNGKNPLSAFDHDTGDELWSSTRHSGGHADRSQPAINKWGRVWQGARDNDFWNVEVATGDVNCRYSIPADGDVTTPLTIGPDNGVYGGSEALGLGWLYKMNGDCTPAWTVGGDVEGDPARPEDAHVRLSGSLKNASPALSPNGDTVFASIKTQAIALASATGQILWRVDISNRGFGSRHPNYAPVVSADGNSVYFGSKDGLWALDPHTGAAQWLFTPPNREEIKSAPALAADGTIYFGASKKRSSHFYALDPSDGSVRWKHRVTYRGAFNNNQAAVGADGRIYAVVGKDVFCLDPAGDGQGGGRVLWHLKLPGKILSGAVLGGNGSLLVGAGKALWKIVD